MSQDLPGGGCNVGDAPHVLFLDFDGVLHALGEEALDFDGGLIANPRLFCWRPLLEHALAPHPHVRIIVSSDWRRLFDDENLSRLLGPALGPRVIGAVSTSQASRAEEILAEARRRGLSGWLALDDHPSVASARRAGDARFIACSPKTGLSDARVQRELHRKLSALARQHQTARIDSSQDTRVAIADVANELSPPLSDIVVGGCDKG